MAEVEGIHTEIGSVYAHDIIAVQKDDVWHTVKLTDSQKKHAQTVKASACNNLGVNSAIRCDTAFAYHHGAENMALDIVSRFCYQVN